MKMKGGGGEHRGSNRKWLQHQLPLPVALWYCLNCGGGSKLARPQCFPAHMCKHYRVSRYAANWHNTTR